MNKNNEKSREFRIAWQMGWAGYIYMPEQDDKNIVEIAEKCAKVAGVDLDVEEGFIRIYTGITSIANYCKDHDKWGKQNLYQINKALQSVLIDMNADKRARDFAVNAQKLAEAKLQEQRNENHEDGYLWIEGKYKSCLWAIENWDYIWEHSEEVYYASGKKICMKYEEAKKALEQKTEEFVQELMVRVARLKEKWNIELYKLKCTLQDKWGKTFTGNLIN